jgi:hypothetical protein
MPTATDSKIVLRVHIPEDRRLPDNAAWTNRFQVKSESSDKLYTIAQSKSGRFWGCNCMGWVRHKTCKHLRTLQLPAYQQPFEAQLPASESR